MQTSYDRLQRCAWPQLHHLILLGFESLLLGGEQLALALHAGLFVVLTLADFREDPRLFALLFESAQSILEGLILTDLDAGHTPLPFC
jgi:hypothetical protein